MGQAKKVFSEQVEEKELIRDLINFLSEILPKNELSGAQEGIAKKIVAENGVNSLSEKQKQVIDGFIEYYKRQHTCTICKGYNVSNLNEYIEIADNKEGLCPTCQYDLEKLNKE